MANMSYLLVLNDHLNGGILATNLLCSYGISKFIYLEDNMSLKLRKERYSCKESLLKADINWYKWSV